MIEQRVDYTDAEALGISHEAYDEVLDIVGHIPTIDQLSTLLAMWESNGRQQSLYGWLRGQKHTLQRDDYLYTGAAENRAIQEPRIRQCLDIARQLISHTSVSPLAVPPASGQLLYMVGKIGTEFTDSEYARRCLHLVSDPVVSGVTDEEKQYISLIITSLLSAHLIDRQEPVLLGGLFFSLLRMCAPVGFDILTPREVRLDSFLFGEEGGRTLLLLPEEKEDLLVQKLGEARLNGCFLGRTTKNRIVVDGYDFGPTRDYLRS